MVSPPGPCPEGAFCVESLLRVLTASGGSNNSLYFQAPESDSSAALSAPLKKTTLVWTQSITKLLTLAPIFIHRCDPQGHERLLSTEEQLPLWPPCDV